jgi:hypothetical protein
LVSSAITFPHNQKACFAGLVLLKLALAKAFYVKDHLSLSKESK